MSINLQTILKSALNPNFDQNWPFPEKEDTFLQNLNGFLGLKNILHTTIKKKHEKSAEKVQK